MFRHLGDACIAVAAFRSGCDESAQEITVLTIATGEHGACLPAPDAYLPLGHCRARPSAGMWLRANASICAARSPARNALDGASCLA